MNATDKVAVPGERGPIFVVGCGRSGTTLLRLMLNGHPNIGIPGETWYFFDDLDKMRDRILAEPESEWRNTVATTIEGSSTFSTLGVTGEQVRNELRRLSRDKWSAILAVANIAFASAEGKRRWGDKTPGYVRCLSYIKSRFPDAYVIHIIRDGRDVVASYLEQPIGPNTALDAAIYWKSHVLRGLEDGPTLLGSRYLEVRYERLTADPEPVLRTICDHVGEEFHGSMLDSANSSRKYIRPDLPFHRQTSEPVTTARTGRWRHQLARRDAELVELEAGALLRRLGYGTETRTSVQSLWIWRHRFVLGVKVWVYRMLSRWGLLNA